MSVGPFFAEIVRMPVELDCSSAGNLVIAFPPGGSSAAPPVCVEAGPANFTVEFPADSHTGFAVDVLVQGTIGNSAFEPPAGRETNPVISFPSGGRVVVTIPRTTGGRRFEEVRITAVAGDASMDPLP